MMHMLNCREVTTRLALGDIGQYAWRERLVIRFHLAICWVCRKYERQMKVIGRAFGLSIENRFQQEDVSKVKERLIEKLGHL